MSEAWIRESNLIEDIDSPEEDRRSADAWAEFSSGPLTLFTILRAHHAITRTQLEPMRSGYWRDCGVRVGRHYAPGPDEVPNLMRLWFVHFGNPKNEQETKDAHVEFERIHPFVDGNGRTGRMVMNWQRKAIGLDPLLIKASERGEYYRWFK